MGTETSSKPKYKSGEKLLCFHGPLLYEAKCLDVKVKNGVVMYFVHYQGWSKNWDEWVTDKRMFKFNEEGLRKQKDLEHQIKSGKKLKALRKSDLKKQSYPPPEIMQEVEETLKPDETKNKVEEPFEPQSSSHVKVKRATVEPPTKESSPSPPAPVPKTAEDNTSVVSTSPSTASESSITVVTTTVTTSIKTVDASRTTAQSTPDEVGPTTSTSNATAPSRRRKGRFGALDGLVENEDGFLSAPQLKVELPDSMKAWLVDDWDLITRQARLYELPASYTISSIMMDFLQYMSNKEVKVERPDSGTEGPCAQVTVTSDLRHEFIAGLQHYFNQVVGSQLLYKFERLQYAELLKQHTDKRMSDIYGSMHLLRLFVKLREMVACTRVDPGSLCLLEALTSEFLDFLHQNRKQYFRLEHYTIATAEYQRRAMC